MKKINIEHDSMPEIICPYCGSEETDSWEIVENQGEQTCDECGETYKFYREMITTYTTNKI